MPRMMFSGKAAAAKANILFDSGASVSFVSAKIAKQTGIIVRPIAQAVRLADDVAGEVLGEANVYVQLGAFHKPVKCFVMNLLFEVDVIQRDDFMTMYNCILHYGKGVVMIQKGKRHLTVHSPPLPRSRLEVDEKSNPDVLSHAQLKWLMRRGAFVYLASLKPVDSDSVTCATATVTGSVGGDSVPSVPTSSLPTTSVPTGQPVQPSNPVSSEKKWVSDLLSEFAEVFQDPLPVGLPPERSEGHSIPTEPGHPPTFRQMYRLSPFEYRALNSITVKNRCTIPRIDDLLDAVSGSQYFISLDLTSGYHQILISEEDRPKTAFRTPFGHFQFKVLIEGLTNAPTAFQTVMNSIFSPYLKKFVVVYLDDILIFSKSEEVHQAHVRLVLDVLRREQFYVTKAKSRFAQTEIQYLGHIVNAQGIRPDPKKVSSVQSWPVPKNVHDVRSFLSLCNYFRKFIDHYSSIAVPLMNLTKKSVGWDWTGRWQDAFEKLKHSLAEAPLLRTPEERKPYEVITDASDYGLGAVLLQEGYPIAFESRKLNSAELNYTVTEKEMLAVVHALRVWRCYLEGAQFTVFTDHVSNTFFQTQPSLSRRQARWSEFIQRFGVFKWEYLKGERNVADALSRGDVTASQLQSVDSDKAQPSGAVFAAAG